MGSPARLRERLFATHRQHSDEFFAICRADSDAIAAAFPLWWAAIPKSPAHLTNEWVQVLGNVALFLSERLGRGELMALVVGDASKNPVTRWQTELRDAEAKLSADPSGAADIGRRVISEIDSMATGGLDEERARALYLVGISDFVSGHVQQARGPFEEALLLYRSSRQLPALGLLLNLFDVDRYLGDAHAAAQIADILASGLQDPPRQFYSRQAAILRIGEPLNRVIGRLDDDRYELDDLITEMRGRESPRSTVAVKYQYRRSRPTIGRAGESLERGLQYAEDRRHEEALVAFDEASSIDPYDPNPAYQMGTIFLELARWREAARAFEISEELAPGWFYARRYAWLSDLARRDKLAGGTVAAAIRADDGHLDPRQRLATLDHAIAAEPTLGMLHLYAGQAREGLGDPARAAGHFREGLAGRTDPDVRTSLLAALGAAVGVLTAEGQDLLAEAVSLDGNIVSAAHARIALALGQ